jgi:hypothetical protein
MSQWLLNQLTSHDAHTSLAIDVEMTVAEKLCYADIEMVGSKLSGKDSEMVVQELSEDIKMTDGEPDECVEMGAGELEEEDVDMVGGELDGKEDVEIVVAALVDSEDIKMTPEERVIGMMVNITTKILRWQPMIQMGTLI